MATKIKQNCTDGMQKIQKKTKKYFRTAKKRPESSTFNDLFAFLCDFAIEESPLMGNTAHWASKSTKKYQKFAK